MTEWRSRDPIKRFQKYLLSESIGLEVLDAIEQQIDITVQESIEFALQAPEPDPADTYTHVYAERPA